VLMLLATRAHRDIYVRLLKTRLLLQPGKALEGLHCTLYEGAP